MHLLTMDLTYISCKFALPHLVVSILSQLPQLAGPHLQYVFPSRYPLTEALLLKGLFLFFLFFQIDI